MKTIGLIGGMSWESTEAYYRLINTGVKRQLGGFHSARIVLYSVDFAEIESLQMAEKWTELAEILCQAAVNVESAGADFLLICTNTMHRIAEQVEQSVNIPLLHIADATAEALKKRGISKVGLLGTAFTMEQQFYKGRLQDEHQIQVLVPNEFDRKVVHDVIYQELCKGDIKPKSKSAYLDIIERLQADGAEAVILGCTEIGNLVKQLDTPVPLFDTTQIHAEYAIDKALS